MCIKARIFITDLVICKSADGSGFLINGLRSCRDKDFLAQANWSKTNTSVTEDGDSKWVLEILCQAVAAIGSV